MTGAHWHYEIESSERGAMTDEGVEERTLHVVAICELVTWHEMTRALRKKILLI